MKLIKAIDKEFSEKLKAETSQIYYATHLIDMDSIIMILKGPTATGNKGVRLTIDIHENDLWVSVQGNQGICYDLLEESIDDIWGEW